MTQHLGWRSIFFLNVLLGLMTLTLILWKLKGEWADSRGERFDVAGSVVYGLSLLAIIYGFSVLPGSLGILLVLLGVLGMFLLSDWK